MAHERTINTYFIALFILQQILIVSVLISLLYQKTIVAIKYNISLKNHQYNQYNNKFCPNIYIYIQQILVPPLSSLFSFKSKKRHEYKTTHISSTHNIAPSSQLLPTLFFFFSLSSSSFSLKELSHPDHVTQVQSRLTTAAPSPNYNDQHPNCIASRNDTLIVNPSNDELT